MKAEMQGGRPVDILLVEDNPGDVERTREALETAKIRCRLHVVEGGVSAMNFLFRRGEFVDAPEPDLILLDLDLPAKEGLKVLAEIKTDPVLAKTPIVVLAASRANEDIVRAYQLHANCYIKKPVDFLQFLHIIAAIEEFWLKVVKLPGRAHQS